MQRDHRRGMARSPRGLRPDRDHRRVALGSWRMDTQGRFPVRTARLAVHLEEIGGMETPISFTAASTAPDCVLNSAMPRRSPRPLADAVGVGAAGARRDRCCPLKATAELTRRAAGVARELAARRARAAAARRAGEDLARPLARPPTIESADGRRKSCQLLRGHEAFRYDAFPPWTDPDTWWCRCDGCGDDRITGAKLKAGPVIHVALLMNAPAMGGTKWLHRRYGVASKPGRRAS